MTILAVSPVLQFSSLRGPLPEIPTPAGIKVLHAAVRGRARICVTALHRDPEVKRAVESHLAGTSGVASVSANPLTGNVLILFDPRLDIGAILRLLEEAVGFAGRAVQEERPSGASEPNHPETASASGTQQPRTAKRANRHLRLVASAPLQSAQNWHLVDVDAALAALGTTGRRGLSASAVRERLSRFGPNAVPKPAPRSDLSMLIGQFKTLPVGLLAASAALSAITGGLADAVVIMAVVAINAGIGFVTERHSEKTIGALAGTGRRSALVLRDGALNHIASDDVVPGDILVLAPGQFVAADARLLETRSLSVDESALTGESLPALKSTDPCTHAEVPLADRNNMVYMGTIVSGGSGLAVVVATGAQTELGRIQQLVGETRPPQTPMQRQLDRLGNQMAWMTGATCGVVFAVGLLRGHGLLQMLRSAVSLAVAAVPEGLPTVATTTLALGIRRLRQDRVLVRHLEAVETLGSVQVICLDKTGTLTVNRMSVVTLFAGMQRVAVREGVLFGATGRIDPYSRDELLRLLHVAVLCNETEVGKSQDAYVLNGTATESALVKLAIDCGVSVRQLRRQYPLTHVEYRAEHHKYMTTVHAGADGIRVFAVKGSPPEVLGLCRWHLRDGMQLELSDTERRTILQQNDAMAAEALRILGFAVGYGGAQDLMRGELIWLGLAGMADPIRHGVKELIALFHQAGIRTAMITGDQSATAYAIGQELRLHGNGPLEIMDATRIESIDPVLLSALAQRVDVFARVSPAAKLHIVQALQRAGRVVAMTGDGINDGPALKAADIGVAMGSGGTDVARDVADIVLEDDDLRTMIVAVGQGRTIYSNIRKSIHFLAATNLSEIAVMLGAITAGMGQPLNPMQLLWINLLTDIFPALALTMEAPEPDVLRKPPRDPREAIISKSDLKRYALESLSITTGTLAAYGYGVTRYAIGPRSSTIAFMTLTFGQLLHAVSCRSEIRSVFSQEQLARNRYLQMALGGSAAVQMLTVMVPGLRSLLGTTAIGPVDALVIAAAAGLPFVFNELTKGERFESAQPATDLVRPVPVTG